MQNVRNIDRIIRGMNTSDGAGVKLKRIFGFYEEGLLDPFLLLDFFGSDNPDDYIAGFPWHPHRGIETVTYMLEGRVEHGDSMGNKGIIGSGDIQWMTAGSGIIHQEMPKPDGKMMYGFQLWVNLPASQKMMKPRYQDIIAKDVPELKLEKNIKLKILAGEFNGTKGPVIDIVADPTYFDISIPSYTEFQIEVKPDYTVFAYVFEGAGFFDELSQTQIHNGEGAILKNGSLVRLKTTDSNVRFILISGKPIKEPIAWRGPIVMNTNEELDLAFREYRQGTFIK
ncbi:MAG: pirin family protein [FCB group bacterium]|jgi:redox-sensitive bicupin YhaK (pirin superfamily)